MKQITEAEVIALASALAGSGGGGGTGDGDMKKSVYDTDNNGIVDNAEKVNNHTVEKDVPSDAVFTDTVYDDTQIQGAVSSLANDVDAKQDANDKMTDADMEEILSVLPIARDNFQKYSTQEQVVGQWIDGKPIYQKTVIVNNSVAAGGVASITQINNIDTYIGFSGTGKASQSSLAQRALASNMGHAFLNDDGITFSYYSVYALYITTITLQYTKTTD